ADDVLVVSNHMPHRLGLVKEAYARMHGKDLAQKSRTAPAHPDDEHRAIDSLPRVVCCEAQVPEHDRIPPAPGGDSRSALKEGIADQPRGGPARRHAEKRAVKLSDHCCPPSRLGPQRPP